MSQGYSKRGRQSQGSKGNDVPSLSSSSSTPGGVHANPHMAHALTSLVGCVVEVKMLSGITYEGILCAISPCMDIALKVAHDKSKPPTRENVINIRELRFDDVVTISAAADRNPSVNSKDMFKTDIEISRNNGPAFEKELQPFTDFTDNVPPLEDESNSHGWTPEEMFEVNREKFQVSSNYDEKMSEYTTLLENEGTEEFKVRTARAAKLASEIEDKEMNRRSFDDTGTEEELFSLVVRGNHEAPPPMSTTFTTSVLSTLPTTATTTTHSAQDSAIPSDSTTTENRNDVFTTKQCKAVGTIVSEILSTTLPQSPVVISNGAAVPCPSVAVLPSQLDHEPSSIIVAKLEGQSLQQQKNESNIEKEQSEKNVTSLERVSPTSVMPVNNVSSKEDSVAPVENTAAVANSLKSKPVDIPVPTSGKEKDTTTMSPLRTLSKLNPNAKEFMPSAFSLPTPVTVVSTQTSGFSSPVVSSTQSSVRTSPSSTHHPSSGSGRRNYNKPNRQQRSTTPIYPFVPQEIPIAQASPGSGGAKFIMPQSGAAMSSGLIRPVLQPPFQTVVSSGGPMVYPVNLPLYPNNQVGLVNPYSSPMQQVVSSGAHGKFSIDPTPPHQLIINPHVPYTPAQQQFLPLIQQQMLVPQVPGNPAGMMLPVSGSQAQLQAFSNSQQLRFPAQPHLGGQQMFSTPQGSISMVGCATPLPVPASVPLQSIHSSTQPTLMSGGGATPTQQLSKPQVFAQNRLNYATHSLAK